VSGSLEVTLRDCAGAVSSHLVKRLGWDYSVDKLTP
jgi:hypothetical protein